MLKCSRKKSRYFPTETNYNYALTTLPYIAPLLEPDIPKTIPKNDPTVLPLPRQLGDYFRYSDDAIISLYPSGLCRHQ